jgi:hypothetical protein
VGYAKEMGKVVAPVMMGILVLQTLVKLCQGSANFKWYSALQLVMLVPSVSAIQIPEIARQTKCHAMIKMCVLKTPVIQKQGVLISLFPATMEMLVQ